MMPIWRKSREFRRDHERRRESGFDRKTFARCDDCNVLFSERNLVSEYKPVPSYDEGDEDDFEMDEDHIESDEPSPPRRLCTKCACARSLRSETRLEDIEAKLNALADRLRPPGG